MKLDKREEEYGNYDAADEKSTEPVEVCRNRRRLLVAMAAVTGCGETQVQVVEVIKEVPVEKVKEVVKEVAVVQEKIVTKIVEAKPAQRKIETVTFWDFETRDLGVAAQDAWMARAGTHAAVRVERLRVPFLKRSRKCSRLKRATPYPIWFGASPTRVGAGRPWALWLRLTKYIAL